MESNTSGPKRIRPGFINGTINAQPSKSMAHRAIICASLSEGQSNISPIDASQDISATIGAVQALGLARCKLKDRELWVDGKGDCDPGSPIIDCGESGSTLRFMIPVSLLFGGARFQGRGRLMERPVQPYIDAFSGAGRSYSAGRRCPCSIRQSQSRGVQTARGRFFAIHIRLALCLTAFKR